MGIGGFFKGLGKVALHAAPLIAAPFTGGASLLASPGLLSKAASLGGKLAPVLGSMAKGRGDAQDKTDTQNLQRDRLALDSYETGLKAPGTRLNTSLAASKIANRKPVSAAWGGPGSGMSGGKVSFGGGYANPDMISPDTKAMSEDIMHQEMIKQMSGKGGPPAMSEPHKSGILDKIIGGGSTAASILGALQTGDDDETATPPYAPVKSNDPWSKVQF